MNINRGTQHYVSTQLSQYMEEDPHVECDDDDDDVGFKVAGMSMMISDCPLNSVNSCLL